MLQYCLETLTISNIRYDKKGLSKYKTEQGFRVFSSSFECLSSSSQVQCRFCLICTTIFGIELFIGNTECQVHILGQWEDQNHSYKIHKM